ncbi:MAG: LPS-assembly protein LptD [Hyphomicrobiales bacterium]|nr:LPS-assembly protein LptD [Hyphomicrobiales bacterium]
MTVGAIIPVKARKRGGVLSRLACAAIAGLLLAPVGASLTAAAQDLSFDSEFEPNRKAQMLVESDQLIYDYDNSTVSAVGNVKIYYVGYTLEAERVTYIEITAKLIATGGVKLTDPSGIVAYAEQIDITNDFKDGFIGSLRVDTPDQTHFAAERAERVGGTQTVFVNGVYTACEPCKDRPEKPPLWQVKSAKIIVDEEEEIIEFHNATFEFYGMPVAWIPYFTTADPSVKRKTGFLAPTFGASENLGWSVGTPYFIALAPSYDVTLTPTYYEKQGFLGEVEWRQRLARGQYTLRMAGIDQKKPKAFLTDAGGGTFSQEEYRGAARTTGQFELNKAWTFGWDGTISTDRTFTRDYDVINDDDTITTSEVHLTGLRDRNYFDLRAEHFQVLTDSRHEKYEQGRQALVTPVGDYQYVAPNPILGGELSLRSNITSLSRDKADPYMIGGETYYRGLAGDYTRLTKEIDWQKKMIAPGGQVFTAFASVRGDLFSINPEGDVPGRLTSDSTPARFMPAAGLEWSSPIMVSAPGATHVFEPMAQIIARPNEQLAGKLENDDALSLVFDDTTLMRRNKFSGDDRVEGGTRVNYALRYLAAFENGASLETLFGQSRMVAGKNSFAAPDIANVGAYSGLETSVSDYVGRVSLDSGRGALISMRGRFDNKDLNVNRGEIEAATTGDRVTAAAAYIYLREQPVVGKVDPVSMISARASVRVFDRWRAFGSAVYDLTNSNIRKDSLGLAYDNSCVSLSVAYNETRGVDIPDRSLTVRLLLRTLAEGHVNTSIN